MKLNTAQMVWPAQNGIEVEIKAGGVVAFNRGRFQVVAAADNTATLWDMQARVFSEEILTTDGSPWACQRLEATHSDLKAALIDLAWRK